MESEKPKFNWQRMLITLGIVVATAAVVGGTTWYIMDKNAKDVQATNEKSAAELQLQADELKVASVKEATPAVAATVAKTETETITTFCQSGGSNYKVSSVQHVTNANGDFVLCKVGYTDMPSGFLVYGKKINNTWTELFKGQEVPSSSLANENKIPRELYGFSPDSNADEWRNWKY
jgi:hypothetical protein